MQSGGLEPGPDEGAMSRETLLITGFQGNASDREMENVCRFMPGYVGAKASLQKNPQVFVRFDSPENMQNAFQLVDQQPVDLHDVASAVMQAHIANSELNNPERGQQFQTRSGVGPQVLSGFLNPMLGVPNSADEPEAAFVGQPQGQAVSAYAEDVRPWKRPRYDGQPVAEQEMDTLCVMNIQEKNEDQNSITSLFQTFEGFVTLQVMPGKLGGQNCFIKFASQYLAQAAMLSAPPHLQAQMARKSLNLAASEPGSGAPQGGKGKGAVQTFQSYPSSGQIPSGDQRPECKFFAQGRCGNGDQCRFQHVGAQQMDGQQMGGQQMGGQQQMMGGGQQVPGGDARPECKFFAQSRCAHGDQCNFRHAGVAQIGAPGFQQGGKGCGKVLFAGEGTADTIVVMNAIEKGYEEGMLTTFWPSMSGFVGMRISEGKGDGRGRHCFTKFANPELAAEALATAMQQNIDAEVARTSLNVTSDAAGTWF